MKKFTLFVALCAAMTLSAQTPEWVAKIEIEGQQINSLNCQKLHELVNAVQKDDTKDMAVTFDHENSVLLFRNAWIKWPEAKNGPFLKIAEKVTIVAEDINEIEMTDAKNFIVTESDVTIKGNEEGDKILATGLSWMQPKDKAAYSGTFAALNGNANLTLQNVTSSATYFEHAIVGTKDANNKVNFENASFGMFVSKEATMEITEMSLNGCYIHKPAGAAFSPELKGIAMDGKLVADTITIRKGEQAIENIMVNDKGQNAKFFRDGQLLIENNSRIYTIQGQEIK